MSSQSLQIDHSKVVRMLVKILVLISLSSSVGWAQSRCEGLFSDRSGERKILRDLSLREVMENETAGKTSEQIAEMNEKTISDIEAEIPWIAYGKRKTAISFATAEMLRSEIHNNPVVKPFNEKYSQPGTSIGYCFGRATFVHMMLLKLGLQKQSIQKIWAVGRMKAGGIYWQFHVATMAYSEKDGWLVIDSNHMHPLPVREWIKHYNAQAEDGRVRFYATDASKFTFELGQYNRIQLGLDVSADKDWYKHYFKDMFTWLKDKRVTEDGVRTSKTHLTAEEKSLNESFADMWRSIVEFGR